MNEEVITQLLLFAAVIIGGLIGKNVIPYLKEKIGSTRWDKLIVFIKYCIRAAEQEYKESGQGQIKKKYVVDLVDNYLALHTGINLNDKEEDAIIEGLVNEIKHPVGRVDTNN